jgi:molybdopterin molybdotransferase
MSGSTGARSYEAALESVISAASPLPSESVPLAEALGRALSERVVGTIALPPWDNAGMDGYAARRDDVRGASETSPVVLRVIGSVAAGADPDALPRVSPGVATRIMTGAPVPPGADVVIRIEDTDRGTEWVSIRHDRDVAGRGNVRPRGEDVASGDLLFDVGTTLGPSHLGVLASIGAHHVAVHRRPRVVLLSGGDELVLLDQFDEARRGRRIVSSTTYALPALLREYGADVVVPPLMPDTLDATVEAFRAAVATKPDAIITTGGVSVGEHDYIRDALPSLGGTIDFWRARIRPGGPIGTGSVAGIPWLGLPGNPVSSMVTGMLFAGPLLRRLGGHARVRHLTVRARMLDSAPTPAPLAHFLRVCVTPGADGLLVARLAGGQGSNLLRTMAVANALLHVPEDSVTAEAGVHYDVLLYSCAHWQ